jgi:hypothetical protein
MSKYSTGLRNAGSYKVSGQPYITGSVVNPNEQIKIEFPHVTKKVRIRIAQPKNIATNVFDTANNDAHWFSFQSNGSSLSTGTGKLPPFGNGTTAGTSHDLDWTYSLWFKYPSGVNPAPDNYLINFYAQDPAQQRTLVMISPSSTTLRFYIDGTGSGNPPGYDFDSPLLTVPDITSNWNHLVITQITSSTHIYVNNTHLASTNVRVGVSDDILKGFNSPSRVPRQTRFDEEMMWNMGMNKHQVSELYNNAEWVNPNYLSTKNALVGWWSYGDSHTDRFAPDLLFLNNFNVFDNLATGVSLSSSAMPGLLRLSIANEEVSYVDGPFDSLSKGKLRVSALSPGFQKGIFLPDVVTNSLSDLYLQFPFVKDSASDSLTISFWFKQGTGFNEIGLSNWFFVTNGGNAMRCRDDLNGGLFFNDKLFQAGRTGTLANALDNNWHHFAITANASSNTTEIFYDGSLVSSDSITITPSIANVFMPRNQSGPMRNWAEVTLWGAALDSTQISELYNSGRYFDPTSHSLSANLESWYRFNDTLDPPDTSTTIFDRVGSNNGTVNVVQGENTATFIQGPSSWNENYNVYENRHYYELSDYGEFIDLPIKTKELYLSADKSQVSYEIIAELTNVPTGSMYALTGSGIDE